MLLSSVFVLGACDAFSRMLGGAQNPAEAAASDQPRDVDTESVADVAAPASPPAADVGSATSPEGDPPTKISSSSLDLSNPLGRWWVFEGVASIPVPGDRHDELKEETYGYSFDGKPVVVDARSRESAGHLAEVEGPVYIHLVGDSLTDVEINKSIHDAADRYPTSITITSGSDEHVELLNGMQKLEVLSVFGAAITADGVAKLRDLPNLQVLRLDPLELTTDAAKALRRFPKLQELYLPRAGFDDETFAEIAGIEHLRVLDMDYAEVTPAGFAHLSELGALEVLHLEHAELEGGVFEHIAKVPSLRYLHLWQSLGGKDATPLAALKNLEVLTLDTIGLETLPSLASWPKLRRLRLAADRGELTDADIEGLDQLTQLEELHLRFKELTGGVIPKLTSRERLTRLVLRGQKLGDDAFEGLADCCRGLIDLRISSTDAGSKAFAAIGKLGKLERLDASNTAVTNAGVRQLAGLAELRRLDLSNTRITAASLAVLRKLPELEYLNINQTNISKRPEGFRDEVQIHWTKRDD